MVLQSKNRMYKMTCGLYHTYCLNDCSNILSVTMIKYHDHTKPKGRECLFLFTWYSPTLRQEPKTEIMERMLLTG